MSANPQQPKRRVSSVRRAPDDATIISELGIIGGLAGTWEGHGFNLIARPDHEGGGSLFLELNITSETLKFDAIGSPIPNRGFAQDDITLFGLTYLQQISDALTKGALHIEPGIWITQPATTAPVENPPPNGGQIVARMATIPHGNSVLAQGSAISVPSLTNGTFQIAPVNTAPFPVGGPVPAPATQGGFAPYNQSDQTPAAVNFRTPFGDTPPISLPTTINGVPLQTVINDPTRLLQQAISTQKIKSMVVLEITTVTPPPAAVLNGGGGIENVAFLPPNANTVEMSATFWLEKIEAESGDFDQLQYVQTVILNFPILNTNPLVNLSWPHVSVATLRRATGISPKGQSGFHRHC